MSIPSTPIPTGPIQDQIAYWNTEAGKFWVARQESQDVTLAPVGEAALDRAGVRPGEMVIDIGCGCGATTIELAHRVGEAGRVLGIDVSQPMLVRARERTKGLANVALVEADATVHPFEAGHADLLFSRLGVMFFADPPKAFTNLRTALKPGGRLAFACFRAPQLNAFFTTALRAATEFVPPPPKMEPGAPGPFAFADDAHVRRILDAAGFKEVKIEPVNLTLDAGSGKGLEQAVVNAREIGPSSRVLQGQPADLLAKAEAAIRKAYAAVEKNGRIPLGAAIWVVTARN